MSDLTLQTRNCVLENQGLVSYTTAWNYQKQLVDERLINPALLDHLILLEHPPVYTLGTGATTNNLRFNPHTKERQLYRVERGGEVTYHCPGQLVGYPILNLKYYQQDLHWYLRQLEEVIIQVLSNYGLKGDRIAGLTGVWIEGKKVAAIGIKVRRWITMHGFAINICPDLTGFQDIIPCGIKDKPVGSLAQFRPDITVEQIRKNVAEAFAATFRVNLISAFEQT